MHHATDPSLLDKHFRARGGYGKLAFFVCVFVCFVVLEPNP